MMLKGLLERLTLKQFEAIVEARRRSEQAAPLEKKRDSLLKAAAKLEKKIARLSGTVFLGGLGRQPRRMSAAARRKIAAAQRRRWAKAKKGKVGRPSKKGRVISAEGRARIAAAQKKRWAAFRAQQ